MIGMRMRQHDCCRRNSANLAQPVGARINHDSGVVMLNEQRI